MTMVDIPRIVYKVIAGGGRAGICDSIVGGPFLLFASFGVCGVGRSIGLVLVIFFMCNGWEAGERLDGLHVVGDDNSILNEACALPRSLDV